MTRISKASTRALRDEFSLARYLLRFSRWAMYSVALERTVAFWVLVVVLYIHILGKLNEEGMRGVPCSAYALESSLADLPRSPHRASCACS